MLYNESYILAGNENIMQAGVGQSYVYDMSQCHILWGAR